MIRNNNFEIPPLLVLAVALKLQMCRRQMERQVARHVKRQVERQVETQVKIQAVRQE